MSDDIKLYNEAPDKYDEVQYLRPDYSGAIERTIILSAEQLKLKKNISLVDFCGGTGSMINKLSEEISIEKAVLIDINQEFLNIAKGSITKIKNFQTICSDIIDAKIEKNFDLVLSVFAYHHVPNEVKKLYLKKAYDCLHEGGVLILTEIYLANKDLAIKYYDKLYNEINVDNKLLKQFLKETAESSDYEYKVAKDFADKQIAEVGFKEIHKEKIWPLDGSFSEDVGTFIQILQK